MLQETKIPAHQKISPPYRANFLDTEIEGHLDENARENQNNADEDTWAIDEGWDNG